MKRKIFVGVVSFCVSVVLLVGVAYGSSPTTSREYRSTEPAATDDGGIGSLGILPNLPWRY